MPVPSLAPAAPRCWLCAECLAVCSRHVGSHIACRLWSRLSYTRNPQFTLHILYIVVLPLVQVMEALDTDCTSETVQYRRLFDDDGDLNQVRAARQMTWHLQDGVTSLSTCFMVRKERGELFCRGGWSRWPWLLREGV